MKARRKDENGILRVGKSPAEVEIALERDEQERFELIKQLLVYAQHKRTVGEWTEEQTTDWLGRQFKRLHL